MFVDVINVKKILETCPHYDEIINFEFDYNDELTIDLIDWYKDLIFSCDGNNENEKEIIKMIDKSMYMYVNDYKYRSGLSKIVSIKDIDLNCEKSIRRLIKKMIDYTNKYESREILNITSSKWI